MLQQNQPHHSTDGLGHAPIVLAVELSELLLKHIPMDEVRQDAERMLLVQHRFEVSEHQGLMAVCGSIVHAISVDFVNYQSKLHRNNENTIIYCIECKIIEHFLGTTF